jgi:signal recognition particle subunit SRP19
MIMIWINIFLAVILLLTILSSYNLVAKGDNKLVIWPEYFDSSLSKSSGRRVSRKLAFSSPNIEEIAKAAKKLKLNPKLERNKTYPGRWWRKSGRVLVSARDKKTKIIKRIAVVIKKSKSK